jgi:GT2 family glycosyltransferase
VVVPNWNSGAFLDACLASVEAQEEIATNILVVDNGSRDDSREILDRRGVQHVALDHNIGFARAVNLGVRATSAPWVLILNVDTVLEPKALRTLVDALRSDPGLGGAQPRILQTADGPPRIYSAGQCLLRDGRAFERGMGDWDGPAYHRPDEIFGVCGAACLMRRPFFTQVGGYDERYFAFWEDVDLNARAQILGWRFRYVPEAVVTHVGSAVWRRNADRPAAFNARLVSRNRLATDIKVMPLSSVPRVLLAEFAAVLRGFAQKRGRATLAGKIESLRWLPSLLRERRALGRAGTRARLERWLAQDPWVSKAVVVPVTSPTRKGRSP